VEIIQVANEIQKKIDQLEELRLKLPTQAEKRAKTMCDYEEKVAVTLIQLRNGAEMICKGEVIKDPPAAIIEKVAKGICCKDKVVAELEDSRYRNLITIIDIIKAQLNGYQSINRHISEN
jgi:hypothetical protein